MTLSAGEWVEVRNQQEILATLDHDGRLDQLPFMPEMARFCGKRFRVWKRAHKTCDTVNRTGGRRMLDTVHLEELRCDGQAHGGCEAACLLFWKEAWLERVDGPGSAKSPTNGKASQPMSTARSSGGCSEGQLWSAVRATGDSDEHDPAYVCQATLLPQATTYLPWWDFRQYLEDYTSGNVSLAQLVGGATYVGYHTLVNRTNRYSPALSAGLVRLYDRFQALVGGVPYPRKWGKIPIGNKTPSRPLNLQAGELVQIRPYREILDTLDTRNKNRGLFFDAEEVPFCGNKYRVRSGVSKIINERTGKMIALKDRNVILEGVWCQARYSDRRMLCPRAIYSIWRETWLERADETATDDRTRDASSAAGADNQ